MSRDLSTLTIAVTGGARGIGEATAERLSRAGARVVIGDRDHALAEVVAERLGERVRAARLDVADPDSWRAFLETAGPLDVLVNNAGIMPIGSILKEPDEVTRTILDVNVCGVINGTKAVAPGMIERGGGQIVNVASAVGRVAAAGGATYSASKFAVVGFSEATRAELRPHGIEVSLVLPTVVRTELAAGIPQARFVREVSAADVAEVIEATIRHPRPELWAPRWTQGMVRATQLLPRAVQEGIGRIFKADQILTAADPAARAAYEERVRRR
jgi:NAD(P)-dependent dehydrogenase (short-subunit alcohol dehydrogenase family)